MPVGRKDMTWVPVAELAALREKDPQKLRTAADALLKRVEFIERRWTDSKECAWCGKPFQRKPTYSDSMWTKTRCCSQSCGSYLRSSNPEYLKKQGAARRAWNAAHPEKNAERIAKMAATKGFNYPSADPKKRGRAVALARFPIHACDDCGRLEAGRKMHRHHIDLNPLNNEPSNVVIVCATCHSRRHHQ